MITTIFAPKGCLYFEYELTLLHSLLIIQDARPRIVEVLLTHIFKR